jgi:protein-S-isoprenylcysteine O-methyltransferase Ste14
MLPNALAPSGAAIPIVAVEMQVRSAEEPHLIRTHGLAYREYAARVGRFFPGIGRLG